MKTSINGFDEGCGVQCAVLDNYVAKEQFPL